LQIFDRRLGEFWAAALGIEVFISKDQYSCVLFCPLRGDPESTGVAEMKQAGRRGCDASAVRMCHLPAF
jgi:hypothetical protein